MRLIKVKAEHNYEVEIGVQYSSAIKQVCSSHNKVLLLAPVSLIKQYKLKESKNLFLLSTPNGESQKNSKFLELVGKKLHLLELREPMPSLDLVGEQQQM